MLAAEASCKARIVAGDALFSVCETQPYIIIMGRQFLVFHSLHHSSLIGFEFCSAFSSGVVTV